MMGHEKFSVTICDAPPAMTGRLNEFLQKRDGRLVNFTVELWLAMKSQKVIRELDGPGRPA
jgi:hypothetical protein